jgi:hypothetical protein
MEKRHKNHPQLLDLLDGYYKCRECGKIAPFMTMSKHSNVCDWNEQQDINPYDVEVQKYLDLVDVRDYYLNNPKKLESEHIKNNKVHIMAQFPSMMVKRLSESIKEQMFVCRQIDSREHTHANQIERVEVKTIRDMVKMKRLEDLEVVY